MRVDRYSHHLEDKEGVEMRIQKDKLFVYPSSPVPLREFIEFWAERYSDPNETLYTKNIGAPRTKESLRELFRWKIGQRLFKTMLRRTVEPYFISQIKRAEELPPKISAEDFLQEFPKGGPIHRIFWLHCWHPDRFPIYDQNVHRGMSFIIEGTLEELSKYADSQKKVESYLRRYVPFFEKLQNVNLPFERELDGVRGRKADRALLMFGKFLPSLPPLRSRP
jgi:hypothetical protein